VRSSRPAFFVGSLAPFVATAGLAGVTDAVIDATALVIDAGHRGLKLPPKGQTPAGFAASCAALPWISAFASSTATAATAMFSVDSASGAGAERGATSRGLATVCADSGAMIGRLAAAIRSAMGRRPVAADERSDCATIE